MVGGAVILGSVIHMIQLAQMVAQLVVVEAGLGQGLGHEGAASPQQGEQQVGGHHLVAVYHRCLRHAVLQGSPSHGVKGDGAVGHIEGQHLHLVVGLYLVVHQHTQGLHVLEVAAQNLVGVVVGLTQHSQYEVLSSDELVAGAHGLGAAINQHTLEFSGIKFVHFVQIEWCVFYIFNQPFPP